MDLIVHMPPDLVPGYLKLLSDQLAASKLQIQALTEKKTRLEAELTGQSQSCSGGNEAYSETQAELAQLRAEKKERQELEASLEARLADVRDQKCALETEARALAEERVLLVREKEKQTAHGEELKKWKDKTVEQVEAQQLTLRAAVEETQRLKEENQRLKETFDAERAALTNNIAELEARSTSLRSASEEEIQRLKETIVAKDAQIAEFKARPARAQKPKSVPKKLADAKSDAPQIIVSQRNSSISASVPHPGKRQMQEEIRDITNSGLRAATGNPDAHMTYANYQRDVQAKLGFQLIGWPTECPFQPTSSLNTAQLAILHRQMREGMCRWEAVPDAEREALLEKYTEVASARPEPPNELPKLKITIPAATEAAASLVAKIPSMTFKQLQSAVSSHISSTLRTATGNASVSMEYAHYERKIKAQLGFQLVGWPAELDMKSVSKTPITGMPELAELYKRLLEGQCRWEEVPASELEELRKKYAHIPQTRSNRGVGDGGRARTVSAPTPNPRKRKIGEEGADEVEGEEPKPKRRTWVWESVSPLPDRESSPTRR